MLEIRNLAVYVDGLIILDDINLKFNNTGLYYINGVSGAGKTTLFKALLNEVDYSGTIEVDGKNISNFDKNTISIINQDIILFDNLTVIDCISYSSAISGQNKDKSYIRELLNKFGIADLENVKCKKLSGGERQRVGVIISIINDSPIILCDEITSNLDEENSKLLLNVISEEAKNRLILLTSHKDYLVTEYTKNIIYLDHGKVVKQELSLKNDNQLLRRTAKAKSIMPFIFLKLNDKLWYSFFMLILLVFITSFTVLIEAKSFDLDNSLYLAYLKNDISTVKIDCKAENLDDTMQYLSKYSILNEVNYIGSLYEYDENKFNDFGYVITEGNPPTKSNEIILCNTYNDELGESYSIGKEFNANLPYSDSYIISGFFENKNGKDMDKISFISNSEDKPISVSRTKRYLNCSNSNLNIGFNTYDYLEFNKSFIVYGDIKANNDSLIDSKTFVSIIKDKLNDVELHDEDKLKFSSFDNMKNTIWYTIKDYFPDALEKEYYFSYYIFKNYYEEFEDCLNLSFGGLNLRVTGIIKNSSESSIVIKTKENGVFENANNYRGIFVKIGDDFDSLKSTLTILKNIPGSYSDKLENDYANFCRTVSFYSWITTPLAIGIGLLIAVFFIIYILLIYKKMNNDIIFLKRNRMSNREISLSFSASFSISLLITSLIGLAFTCLINFIVNTTLSNKTSSSFIFEYLSFNHVTILVSLLMFIILSLLFYCITYIRIRRSK